MWRDNYTSGGGSVDNLRDRSSSPGLCAAVAGITVAGRGTAVYPLKISTAGHQARLDRGMANQCYHPTAVHIALKI